MYYLQVRRLAIPISTFPSDTQSHLGWLLSDDDIVARSKQWPGEASAILDRTASAGTPHLWIILDSAVWDPPPPGQPLTPRQQLTLLLIHTATAKGGEPWSPLRTLRSNKAIFVSFA